MIDHLPPIISRTIPHEFQNYNTAGDYFERDNTWVMSISENTDFRMEALVFLHEFVEMCLTTQAGIPWADIDVFDTAGEGKGHPDPGTLESAPYHKQHMQATELEKQFAAMLGVDWDAYNQSFEEMEYPE